jgi:hypothetical protein
MFKRSRKYYIISSNLSGTKMVFFSSLQDNKTNFIDKISLFKDGKIVEVGTLKLLLISS